MGTVPFCLNENVFLLYAMYCILKLMLILTDIESVFAHQSCKKTAVAD